ncbi:MAG: protein kinase [Elusimicrobia bacterium]|nr:protein kinase [Elusimicrobiota bacterium]
MLRPVLIAALAAFAPLGAGAQTGEWAPPLDRRRGELKNAEKNLGEALTRLEQALQPLESLAQSYPLQPDPRILGPKREAARLGLQRLHKEALAADKDLGALRGLADTMLVFAALGATAKDSSVPAAQRPEFMDVERRGKMELRSENVRIHARAALSADEAAWTKALDTFERRRRVARKAAMPGGALLAALALLLAMKPRPKEPAPEASAPAALAAAFREAPSPTASLAPPPEGAAAQLAQGFRVIGPAAWSAGGPFFDAQAPDGRGVMARRVDPSLFLDQKEEPLVIAAAQAACRLSHPGLARVLGAFQHQGALFIASERPAGTLLSTCLGEGRRMQLRAVKMVVSQAAAALDFAHGQGFAHLALHPGEFFVTDQGRTTVAELGVAHPLRLLCSRKSRPESEAAAPFLAPELELGDARPAADVYALAAIAYRLLAGAPPFPGPNPLSRKRAMAFIPLSKILPAAGIDAVFIRALANEPARRHKKAGEFAAALSALPEPALPKA